MRFLDQHRPVCADFCSFATSFEPRIHPASAEAGSSRRVQHRYANTEVSYLPQKVEAHNGLTILATNLSKRIDKAFHRTEFTVWLLRSPGGYESR